jgi:hypothetical protein
MKSGYQTFIEMIHHGAVDGVMLVPVNSFLWFWCVEIS